MILPCLWMLLCAVITQALDVCPGPCQDKQSCETPVQYNPYLSPDHCRPIVIMGSASPGFMSAVIWHGPEHEVRLQPCMRHR
jgi:hypothetical protein